MAQTSLIRRGSILRLAPWLTVDIASLVLASAFLVARFLQLHAALAPSFAPPLQALPPGAANSMPPGFGWWSAWDQGWYLESALAWARLDLNPNLHLYPPAYSLLGALFTRLTPADPFLLPDLGCLLGTMWVFAALAGSVFADVRFSRSVAAWVFIATTLLPETVLSVWVQPWTTTPAALCLMGCLFGTVRVLEHERPRDGFVAGFAAAAACAFRPADGAIVGASCAAVAALAATRRWPHWRVCAASVFGAAVPLALYAAAYTAVNGLQLDRYLRASAKFGFEWRLLPLRWVALMIDPAPVFLGGHGLAFVFPWIVPGLVGMAVCLLQPGSVRRFAHGAIVAATMADTVLLLCYRDLHSSTLWYYSLYHYFKWMLPVFGLYAAAVLRAFVAGPRLLALAAAAAVVACLFMWRLELTDPVQLARPPNSQTLLLPHGLSALNDVLLARLQQRDAIFYPFASEIRTGTKVFPSAFAFKLTPLPWALMLQPVRPMPDAPSTLSVPAPVYEFDPASSPILARQSAVWGLPCWVRPERLACQAPVLLPLPDLPFGKPLSFGAGGAAMVYPVTGVAQPEPEGTWTLGPRSTISFRLAGAAAQNGLKLALTAFAYIPPRGRPTVVHVWVNGVPIARWMFGTTLVTQQVAIPAAALQPDGNVLIGLDIENPRRPSDTSGNDTRLLGLFMRSFEVGPAA